MSDFERPGTTVEEPPKRRSAAERWAELSDRVSRAFNSGLDHPRQELPGWVTGEEPDYPGTDYPATDYPDAGDTVAWSASEQRFPLVRQGYDCVAVDREVAGLERELAELKTKHTSTDEVSAEIDRIGTQTAAVLQAAYEQAAEITRDAREQADRCLSDAAANAVQITEDANRRLRDLDVETDSVWQERSRLIDDARSVSSSLLALADEAAARFPTESDKPDEHGPQFPQRGPGFPPLWPVANPPDHPQSGPANGPDPRPPEHES